MGIARKQMVISYKMGVWGLFYSLLRAICLFSRAPATAGARSQQNAPAVDVMHRLSDEQSGNKDKVSAACRRSHCISAGVLTFSSVSANRKHPIPLPLRPVSIGVSSNIFLKNRKAKTHEAN